MFGLAQKPNQTYEVIIARSIQNLRNMEAETFLC